MFKKIICICLSALIVFSICGCDDSNIDVSKYDINAPVNNEITQTVAANSNYELLWDSENYCVMLKCNKTGKIWSNIPYEYILQQGTSNAVNSTLNITVMNTTSMKWDEIRGYTEVVQNGRISSEKIDNGIKIIYYFDNYKISIPVEYTLRSDSLEAVIKTANIIEGAEYRLVAVTLNPYLTSAVNDKDSYLVVPTGSGALMYTDERAEKTREYKGAVYGEDASRIIPEITNDPQQIYLPIFGSVQTEDNALLGIIEKGAESALIEAEAGNSRTGYSTIYPNFYVRGYDAYPTNLHSWSYKDLKYISDNISEIDIKVGYYPLSGEKANYNGMAQRYRQYLTDTKMLKESKIKANEYSVSVLGGLLKKVSTLGIPREKTTVLTTFSQAKEIIADISNKTKKMPSVQMVGYGNNGTDAGKIGGGFGFIRAFGTDKDWKTLEDYSNKLNINLFTDFDLIRFSESGSGFSYLSDSAKSATLHVAESYYINYPLRDYDQDHAFRFLKRSEISTAVDKLISIADKNDISGLSVSTLGNLSYSDYSDMRYAVKGNTENDVTEFIKKISKSGHDVAVTSANAYAAAAADTIFCAPLTNGEYDAFDQWIPFYQMVFSGTQAMYSEYLNIADSATEQILRAVASGTGLGFALSYDYDMEAAVNSTFCAYGTQYEGNKDFVVNTVNEYGQFISAVANSQLLSYETKENGLSISSFSNGVTLYVNHSENTIVSPVGEMPALSVIQSKN